MPTFEWKCLDTDAVFETSGSYEQAKSKALEQCPSAIRHFSTPTMTVSQSIDSLQVPSWYKDRITNMNKQLGTKVKPPK